MIKASILWMTALLFLFPGFTVHTQARDWTVSLFAGRMTGEAWEDAVAAHVEYEDAYLAALSIDCALKHYFDKALTLEVEAQVARYFGDQDHFEFNLPLVGVRWHRFPWQRHLATTFAYGIGPSYATELPTVEASNAGDSERWMIYWFGEFTFGPPKGAWGLLLRLHHRSGGFGVVADQGGSNSIAAGLRFCF